MDVNLSKFCEIVEDREAWHAAVPGVEKTTTTINGRARPAAGRWYEMDETLMGTQHHIWASTVTDSKESTCNAGNPCSIPGSGRSPGGGPGNPLQCCLENPMDRGARWLQVHRVKKSRTRLGD